MFHSAPDFRKEASVIQLTEDGSTILEVGMVMCCHCGGHFERESGSGIVRGFCMNCNGHVCGPGCAECVNYEKQLDMLDGGLDPTAVKVGRNPAAETSPGLWLPPD